MTVASYATERQRQVTHVASGIFRNSPQRPRKQHKPEPSESMPTAIDGATHYNWCQFQ
ncbi:MAG: hypothetical protein KDE24_20395 [Caldilinea sp.]|nr:hypothetical protein [Caldilinea sp.]